MARTPCFRCDEKFEGEAQNVYWSYFKGDESIKLRYLVCTGCLEEMAGDWLGKALHRGRDGRWHDPDEGETLSSMLESPQEAPTTIQWRKVG